VLVYFGLAGAALLYGLSLLHAKYIKKTKRARRDRGAYTYFAIFMFLVSIGAFALGVASQ
jgi:hypothetical protein